MSTNGETPTNISLHDIQTEGWTTEQPHNRYLAAYRVGRLLNCLDWSTLRASMCRSGHINCPPAKVVLVRLVEMLAFLDPRLTATVDRSMQRWHDWCRPDQEDWIESLRACDESDHYHESDWRWPDHSSWDFLNPVRSALDAELNTLGQQSWRLGQKVDAGLRPFDGVSPAEEVVLRALICSESIDPRRMVYSPLWYPHVTSLCAQVGLRLEDLPDHNTIFEAVVRVDEQIRRHLATLQDPHPARDQGECSVADADLHDTTQTANLLPQERSPQLTSPALSIAEYDRLRQVKREIDPEDKYIGESVAILRVFERIRILNSAPTQPVLILGESGVGKTALAELVHRDSRRAGRFEYFQATAALGSNEAIVIEKWTGYGKNSTVQGADKAGRSGLLQLCGEGTIFVDELHAAPGWFQRFLLQILDGRPVQLAHGKAPSFVPDVRLIFASNEPEDRLAVRITHDLWRRLRNCILEVSPLRERKEDIPFFIRAWYPQFKPEPAFLLALLQSDWPDNVGGLRSLLGQLAGCLEREKRGKFSLELLRSVRRELADAVTDTDDAANTTELYRFYWNTLIRQGLEKGQGLQKRMSELLRVSEPTVCRELAKLELT